MSQYSQMLGSFERTGSYPMESNYIFPTKAELDQFYEEEINKATIHAGLFRIVLNDEDNKQALYWAYLDENEEFVFDKLFSTDTIKQMLEDIAQLREDLEAEIQARQEADQELADAIALLQEQLTLLSEQLQALEDDVKAIVGTNGDIQLYLQTLPYHNLTEIAEALNKFLNTLDPNNSKINTLPELQAFLTGYDDTDTLAQLLQDLLNTIYGSPIPTQDFRTLRAIEDFVRILKAQSENEDIQIHTELDRTQLGIGLNGDGSFQSPNGTNYIDEATSVMDALRLLDAEIESAISNYNIQARNEDVVDLTVTKELNKQVIKAVLKLSASSGNQLTKKNDGLYYNAVVEYNAGTITFKVNNNIVSQFNIGISGIVHDATYDPTTEEIVITFNLHDGQTQVVRINAASLIREWETQNDSQSPITLTKTSTLGQGTDKLSATAKISSNINNILTITNGNLEVIGTAENIKYNDTTVKAIINSLVQSNENNEDDIEDLQTAITGLTTRVGTLETNRTSDLATLNNRITTLETKHDTDIQTLTDDWQDDFTDFTTTVNTTLLNFERRLIQWNEYE